MLDVKSSIVLHRIMLNQDFDDKKTRLDLRLSEELKFWLEDNAIEKEISVSAVIRTLIQFTKVYGGDFCGFMRKINSIHKNSCPKTERIHLRISNKMRNIIKKKTTHYSISITDFIRISAEFAKKNQHAFDVLANTNRKITDTFEGAKKLHRSFN